MASKMQRAFGRIVLPAVVASFLVLGTTPSVPAGATAGISANSPLVRLLGLIAPDIMTNFPCTTLTHPTGGAIAQIDCVASGQTSIPPYDAYYYLYSSKAQLSSKYANNFLKQFGIKQGGTSCGSFTTFTAGCETNWNLGGKNKTLGRVTEFDYPISGDTTLHPTIVATVATYDLLVQLTGPAADADALVKWWSTRAVNWV